MLQVIVNVLFVLMMLGFIVLVLIELGRSQKQMEDVQRIPVMLRVGVDLKNLDGPGWKRFNYHAETLQELQEYINSFAMFRIQRAAVWEGTTMTHVMNPVGVLEAV